MFNLCLLEKESKTSDGTAFIAECMGRLIPVKVVHLTGGWYITWKCTKCGRTFRD